MHSRIASLENAAEPDVWFRHQHAVYKRDSATTSKIHELSPAQQTAGNLATQRLLHSGAMQPKLIVSQPGDVDEQEADRIADEVVSGTSGSVAQGNCGASPSDSPSLKRKAGKSPQAKAAPDQGANASPTVQNQIPSQLGGGQPLAEPEKAFLNPGWAMTSATCGYTRMQELWNRRGRSMRSPTQ